MYVCSVQYAVSLLFASVCYFLVTGLMFYNVLCMFVSLFCIFVFCFVYSVFYDGLVFFCIFFLLLYDMI
jgi:hypothetical protein